MSQWMSRASPLGHNSSILSCRGKTSLRLWKTQFTRSINCHSYATHKTNTLQGLDCDAIQWRRTFFRLVSFRYTSDEIRGFCVCECVCMWHLHPEVLAAGSEIRPRVFICCQLKGRMSELGGAINACTLACSWMFSDPNTCWLGKQSEKGERGDYEINYRDEEGGRSWQLTGEKNGSSKSKCVDSGKKGLHFFTTATTALRP